MSIIEVIVLALVQGLTEFLPVSSSGHLVVVRLLFGFSDVGAAAFDAFLHLGTLAAVLVYYRQVWSGLLRDVFSSGGPQRAGRDLAIKLVIATIPAAIVGYLFEDVINEYLRTPRALSLSLAATAAVLFVADRFFSAAGSRAVVRLSDAFVIGLAQITALIPAVSRSAVTIAAGRARGLSRPEAVTFSFLMSAPIIAGAGLDGLWQVAGSGLQPAELLLGFILSFLSGWAAIALLVKLIQRISFLPFCLYLIVIAAALWYAQ